MQCRCAQALICPLEVAVLWLVAPARGGACWWPSTRWVGLPEASGLCLGLWPCCLLSRRWDSASLFPSSCQGPPVPEKEGRHRRAYKVPGDALTDVDLLVADWRINLQRIRIIRAGLLAQLIMPAAALTEPRRTQLYLLLAEASTYPKPKSITHLRTFSDNGVYVALQLFLVILVSDQWRRVLIPYSYQQAPWGLLHARGWLSRYTWDQWFYAVSEPRETHSPMLKARFLHFTILVAAGIEPGLYIGLCNRRPEIYFYFHLNVLIGLVVWAFLHRLLKIYCITFPALLSIWENNPWKFWLVKYCCYHSTLLQSAQCYLLSLHKMVDSDGEY